MRDGGATALWLDWGGKIGLYKMVFTLCVQCRLHGGFRAAVVARLLLLRCT